jgi:hypothetical protein
VLPFPIAGVLTLSFLYIEQKNGTNLILLPISFSLTANPDILLLRKDSALFDKTVLNLLKREKCTARARIPAPQELGLHKTLEGVPSASQISQDNLGSHEHLRDFTII